MANNATLKAAIQNVIKQNGNNEITGPVLQQALLSMVNSLGANYQYAGIATPATNPGTPDQNVFYLASTAGTYTNFNGIILAGGELAILKYNGSWTKDVTGAATKESRNNTITVAAYDSTNAAKENADIVAASESDGISAINTAVQLLGATGGKVYLRNGTYGGTSYVDIQNNNVVIEGESYGVVLQRTGGSYTIIGNSNATGIFVRHLTSAQDVARVIIEDVVIQSREVLRNHTTYEYIIAASNTPDSLKKVAQYVCTGTDDQIIINTVIGILTNVGGRVKLLAGTYYLTGQIAISHPNVVIEGEIGGTRFDVSGLSESIAIITTNNSTNVTVIGVNVAGKSINLNNSGNGYIYASTYLGEYRHFDRFPNASKINSYNYLIAASDAPDKIKQIADYVCDGVDDNAEINTAILYLPANKGGIIQLSPGTFNLNSYISIQRNGVTIKGCGYATVLNRSNPICVGVEPGFSNAVIMDLNLGAGSFGINATGWGTGYVYRCWANNTYCHQLPFDGLGTIFVPAASGIAGINTAINSLGTTGGKIQLQDGEYTGTNGIELTGSNVIIEGNGPKTVIHRTNSTNDLYCNTQSSRNNIVRNLTLYSSFIQGGKYPIQRFILENVYNNGVLINQCADSNVIINVGESYYFKNISTPYSKIISTNWIYSNRFEIHIHGHILETAQLWFEKPVNLIGHHALVELNGPRGINAVFGGIGVPYVADMLGWKPVEVRDIHFIKTGCFNYWNDVCVSVQGSNWKFVNCVFENASSSPSPFDNSTQQVGDEDHNGCRRHGISVTISTYGKDCETEFHNCIGIGSPYGFQSSRGWYFMAGSPKLFNCIGYGGGIGEFGHGFISHEASDAQLFNCIGYAGVHTYRQGAGFRYQAHGKNNLIGCVGYGSNGTQQKSEGIPYATLHNRCVEAGITDESFFYNGSVVDYDGLTIKSVDDGYNASRLLLGNTIKNSDIVITELGGVSEAGFGISLWAHNGLPLLENCIGYAGHGANSVGLKIQDSSKPKVIGGYFGVEKQMCRQYLNRNNGSYCTFNIPTNLLSQYTPYVLKGVGINIFNSTYFDRHFKIYLETDEATPQVIIDGYDTYHVSSIGRPEINNVHIPAGVGLKAYIMENGSIVSDFANNTFMLLITFEATPTGAKGVSIENSASPLIENADIEHISAINVETDAVDYLVKNCTIIGDTTIETNKTGLRIVDCMLQGTTDVAITFANKVAVNDSSNYEIS